MWKPCQHCIVLLADAIARQVQLASHWTRNKCGTGKLNEIGRVGRAHKLIVGHEITPQQSFLAIIQLYESVRYCEVLCGIARYCEVLSLALKSVDFHVPEGSPSSTLSVNQLISSAAGSIRCFQIGGARWHRPQLVAPVPADPKSHQSHQEISEKIEKPKALLHCIVNIVVMSPESKPVWEHSRPSPTFTKDGVATFKDGIQWHPVMSTMRSKEAKEYSKSSWTMTTQASDPKHAAPDAVFRGVNGVFTFFCLVSVCCAYSGPCFHVPCLLADNARVQPWPQRDTKLSKA